MESFGLDPVQLEALSDHGTVRTYPRRTVVFQEGDLSDHLYVVLSGRVKTFLADADGKEITLDTLGPGQVFGEMALDGRPRSASVVTTEPSRLSVIPREALKTFLAEQPDAAFGLLITVIRRARNLTRVIGNLALLDVYGRVAHLLLDNAVEQGGRLVVNGRITRRWPPASGHRARWCRAS